MIDIAPPALLPENFLKKDLVDALSVGGEKPVAATAAMEISRLFEQTEAGRVVGRDAAPELMQMQGFAGVTFRRGERVGGETAAAAGRCDDYAHARPQVLRIEFEEVDGPDCRAAPVGGVGPDGCDGFDRQPQLARGIDVETLFVDEARKDMAGERSRSSARPPRFGVVLPFVHGIEIARLQSPQTTYTAPDVHVRAGLKSYDLVVYQHRYAQRAGVFRHFRLSELGVLVYEVERVFVGRRLQGQHDVIARLGEVAAHDHGFGVERVDEESHRLAQLLAHLLDKLYRKVVVVLRRRDDVVDVDLLAAVELVAQDGVHAALDELDDLLLDGDARNLGLETDRKSVV